MIYLGWLPGLCGVPGYAVRYALFTFLALPHFTDATHLLILDCAVCLGCCATLVCPDAVAFTFGLVVAFLPATFTHVWFPDFARLRYVAAFYVDLDYGRYVILIDVCDTVVTLLRLFVTSRLILLVWTHGWLRLRCVVGLHALLRFGWIARFTRYVAG